MGKMKLWRRLSHDSGALLAMHVALLAIFVVVGSFMGIIAPQAFVTTAKIIVFSGVITLSVFCLSTQFYLGAKRRAE